MQIFRTATTRLQVVEDQIISTVCGVTNRAYRSFGGSDGRIFGTAVPIKLQVLSGFFGEQKQDGGPKRANFEPAPRNFERLEFHFATVRAVRCAELIVTKPKRKSDNF